MLKDKVFLTQTDTTVGFVSQNFQRLDEIKKRPSHKQYIKAVNSLKTLKEFTRVPTKYKKIVRRAKKTTFVMPNKNSYRVIRDNHHLLLLQRFKWLFTTSANLSNQNYDEKFAKEVVDIIITPLNYTPQSSSIYKLGIKQIKKIR
ncbi:MAG: Sua5/YciO/YrdC/YwlC family protein [Sulfurovum sp.]